MKNWDWRAAAAGAAAGLANGFFGAGGGMLLVPLLAGWCRLPGKTCFTTALAVMLPLTLVSLAIYWHSGQLPFSLAWPYLARGFAPWPGQCAASYRGSVSAGAAC